MNSLALLGEFSGSRGSFRPCVPRLQRGVCRPVPAACIGPSGNLCAAGRRTLCRHHFSIAAKSTRPTTRPPEKPSSPRSGASCSCSLRPTSWSGPQQNRTGRLPVTLKLGFVLRQSNMLCFRDVRRLNALWSCAHQVQVGASSVSCPELTRALPSSLSL